MICLNAWSVNPVIQNPRNLSAQRKNAGHGMKEFVRPFLSCPCSQNRWPTKIQWSWSRNGPDFGDNSCQKPDRTNSFQTISSRTISSPIVLCDRTPDQSRWFNFAILFLKAFRAWSNSSENDVIIHQTNTFPKRTSPFQIQTDDFLSKRTNPFQSRWSILRSVGF